MMENIQELFTYQAVPQQNAQINSQPNSGGPSYTNLNAPKEIYTSGIPNLNVQHFNYDPNTQWISMPVIPSSQNSQTTGHLQQVTQQQHMTPSGQIQIQTPGVSVQRAQTVQYQQPSGETINVAIIQPLFIVNDQQGLIQQIEALPHSSTGQQNLQQNSAVSQTQLDAHTTQIAQSLEQPVPEKPKRKPKRAPEVIKAQREEYLRKKVERHAVKPACNCKFHCAEKISEARRIEINKQYWQLPYDKQRDFILHSVEILDVKRRKRKSQKMTKRRKVDEKDDRDSEGTNSVVYVQIGDGDLKEMDYNEQNATSHPHGKETDTEEPIDNSKDKPENGNEGEDEKKFRRGWTRVYSLKGDDGKFLTVCKAMFLTTLGFPEKVDGALRFLNKQQKGDIRARSPQRGKATPMKGATAKIDREIIKNHILSYKPVVVGRKKGQIRYLPGDLSMRKMHTDFKSKYTERNVSYTIYSEVFRSLNIVFRKDPKLN